MKKKTLDKKLQNLRKELGQTIVVHIGIPADNQFEILGVECCGTKKRDDTQIDKIIEKKLMEGKENEAEAAYIG